MNSWTGLDCAIQARDHLDLLFGTVVLTHHSQMTLTKLTPSGTVKGRSFKLQLDFIKVA
jgi:hypothetical protein